MGQPRPRLRAAEAGGLAESWQLCEPPPAAPAAARSAALMHVLNDDRFPLVMVLIRSYLPILRASQGGVRHLYIEGGRYCLRDARASRAAYVGGVEGLRVSCRALHRQIFPAWALGIEIALPDAPPTERGPGMGAALAAARRWAAGGGDEADATAPLKVVSVFGPPLLVQPPSLALRARQLRALNVTGLDRLGFMRAALLAGRERARPPSAEFANRVAYSLLPELLCGADHLRSLSLTLPAPLLLTRMPDAFLALPRLQQLRLEISVHDLNPTCFPPGLDPAAGTARAPAAEAKAEGKAAPPTLVIGRGALCCPALRALALSSCARSRVELEAGALPPSLAELELTNAWPSAVAHLDGLLTLRIGMEPGAAGLPSPVSAEWLPPGLRELVLVAPGRALRVDPDLPPSLARFTVRAEAGGPRGPRGSVELLPGRLPDDLESLDVAPLVHSFRPRTLPPHLERLSLELRGNASVTAHALPPYLRSLSLRMDPRAPHALPPLPDTLEKLALLQVPASCLTLAALPRGLREFSACPVFRPTAATVRELAALCPCLRTVKFDPRAHPEVGRELVNALRKAGWSVEGARFSEPHTWDHAQPDEFRTEGLIYRIIDDVLHWC